MADTQVAPAPEPATTTIPAPTITAGWATPAGQQSDAPKEAKEKAPKRRGIPAGPALAGAGNATAMGLTAAAEAGGLPALAAAGGVVALGTVAAVVSRRRAVKRRQTAAANRWSSLSGGGSRTGSWGGSGGGSGSGSRGSGWGGSRTGSAGSPWRASSGSAGSVGGGSRAGSGSPTGGGSHRTGTGASSTTGGSGQVRDRRDSGRTSGTNGAGSNSSRTTKATPSAAQRAAHAAAQTARTVGAGTAKAWKASRPHRAKTWSATKKAGRKARGLTADALRALRTGVWGTIRHWSIKKGLGNAWAAWKQHRANRKNKQTATTDLTKPERTISSVARKPANSSIRNPLGGIVMPGHHFTGPATEMARAAAAYEPQGMLQVGADFAGLQQALELVAEAMRVTVEQAHEKHPLHPQIVEVMENIHGLQLKASELASELPAAFKSLHEVDIARLENPRKGLAGERMWDIANNIA